MSSQVANSLGRVEGDATTITTLDSWIQHETIPFSLDDPETFAAAVDTLIASLDESVQLLGFGEALHGGEELMLLRNRLFQRLVEAHGFTAIAIESSFPRSRLLNTYVLGQGADSYEAVRESGFSTGFRGLEANHELIAWMRDYNTDPANAVKLHFYGFDSPTYSTFTDTPRHVLHFALDYLTSIDQASGEAFHGRIDPLLGDDFAWENPAAMMDHTQAFGLSPAAAALRVETEELISELGMRRPELVAASDENRYLEALHDAVLARQLLNYHAELARNAKTRVARLLGIRDAIMADNLAYIAARERRERGGKVLVFAHNTHLKRSVAGWQLGPDLLTWWPAGAHLDLMFGSRYVVIGSGVGVSEANGIGQPEPDTLEARLITATPGAGRFIPTHQGQRFSSAEIESLPARSGSTKNHSYYPLTPHSLTDFDWLAMLDSVTYTRGGWPLP